VITEDSRPQLAGLAPSPELSVVAIEPPGAEPGTWSGAPSAVRDGGDILLAYRLRRPIGHGRGYAVAIGRSTDGVHFETIQVITREEMQTESLERPALVRTPAGTWRLYLSCATWGTKHWRVELLEAAAPDAFDARQRVVVLPGDAGIAVKDPVVRHHDGTWHLWASVHPLDDPASTDRMTTDYATSPDGVAWTWHGHALTPRPGEWDSRGVRVSAVRFGADEVVAYYDGRASAAENYEERTGVAIGASPATLTAIGTAPVGATPAGSGGLRYVDIVDLGNGRERWYYELTRPDGAHELRTELRQPRSTASHGQQLATVSS
jgi:hypothetical protein